VIKVLIAIVLLRSLQHCLQAKPVPSATVLSKTNSGTSAFISWTHKTHRLLVSQCCSWTSRRSGAYRNVSSLALFGIGRGHQTSCVLGAKISSGGIEVGCDGLSSGSSENLRHGHLNLTTHALTTCAANDDRCRSLTWKTRHIEGHRDDNATLAILLDLGKTEHSKMDLARFSGCNSRIQLQFFIQYGAKDSSLARDRKKLSSTQSPVLTTHIRQNHSPLACHPPSRFPTCYARAHPGGTFVLPH
jgi:hypothetical protein